MYDFIRFSPESELNLGFKGFVYLLENPPEKEFFGYAIKASSVEELRSKLKSVRNTIVGVECTGEVAKEAVMRKKVDVILDSDDRELDYATFKLAKEKDVAIEFGLSKFLRASYLKRAKLFSLLKLEAKIVKKLEVPFILTSSASNFYELRTRKQIESFFSYFGFDVLKSRKSAETIVRRYYDKNYLMDGVMVEE